MDSWVGQHFGAGGKEGKDHPQCDLPLGFGGGLHFGLGAGECGGVGGGGVQGALLSAETSTTDALLGAFESLAQAHVELWADLKAKKRKRSSLDNEDSSGTGTDSDGLIS
ncbi:hypothetical protein HAX54_035550 [Datura stramonium]|uniref:Uncharacterized protein n=1 Tax=Datura stramonium TaxID=4076 RepID=A0ABS8SFD1_DATST|nr:hypothetical protein [Datura stramonium]